MRYTRIDTALVPVVRGASAVLMLHHVRPRVSEDLAPNLLLEVTPEFLKDVVEIVCEAGLEAVSMDEAHQ